MKGISAAKAHRRSVRRRDVNRHRIRTIRTQIRRARETITAGGADASEAVQRAVVALDRAKGKGTVHSRNADRRKSRLVRMLNKTAAA